MNSLIPKLINTLIFLIIFFQLIIIYLNTKPSTKIFSKKNITVENFSSIVLSKSGINKIGSERLDKISENKIFLGGKSYLENKDYKIYGTDIYIYMDKEISSSNKSVEVINSMGILNAKGFENLDSEGKIFFKGLVTFKTHD
tara:strand:+ start:1588 stop:2013 length:426 start_codon:yes stop_codon:yes gene_type:complete